METQASAPVIANKGTFPAIVAKVIDKNTLVINKGEIDGIRESQRMLVYCNSNEEIKDPNTGESLGYLEVVRGTGKIIRVQEKISTLESDKVSIKPESKLNSLSSLGNNLDKKMNIQKIQKEIQDSFNKLEELLKKDLSGFDDPQVGDLVKPI